MWAASITLSLPARKGSTTCVCAWSVSRASVPATTRDRRAIGDEMHKRIMARISVEIVDPGALPRTFSKAKRITDLRLSD